MTLPYIVLQSREERGGSSEIQSPSGKLSRRARRFCVPDWEKRKEFSDGSGTVFAVNPVIFFRGPDGPQKIKIMSHVSQTKSQLKSQEIFKLVITACNMQQYGDIYIYLGCCLCALYCW